MWPENTTLSTSGQTQATSRIKCKAKGDLTKIKVLYANGSCHPSAAAGNQAVNIKSFVEHPAGVFTQLPIAGSTSPYALGTTEGKETDEVSIAIPHNADFWIRTHVSVSSGQWTVAFFSGGNGSGVEYGVDKSSSGTIANSVTACFAPCAIIGYGDVRPAFVMVGDSIMTGANDNRVGVAGTGDYKTDGADAEGPIGLAGRALLQDFPFMAWYKGGANSAHINSTALAKIISALGYCTHALSQMGVNNLSSTHAQIRTDHNNMYSLLKANLGGNKVVYQTTITPASVTSTNNYITTGGQTPGANESKRVLINPDIRGTYFGSNLDGYLEITDLYETARDSGIYKVPSTYDETNTATGGSTSTLTRTGAGWTVDIWVNYSVRIVAGTNNGSSARISTNSNQTLLSLSPAMPGANDATSVYEIWAVATRDGTHLNPGPNGYAVGAAAIRTWLEAQAV